MSKSKIISEERFAVLEEVTKRHDNEILSLRDSRHHHAGFLQKHDGMFESYNIIISGIKEAIDKLTASHEKSTAATAANTKELFSFKVMAMTAIFMGGGFISFCVFVGGKLLNWW